MSAGLRQLEIEAVVSTNGRGLDPKALHRQAEVELESIPSDDRPQTERIAEAVRRARLHPSVRMVPGGTFVLDEPDIPPAIWGEGEDIAWIEGEPLLIVGPISVGKTTIAGQLVRGRLGLGKGLLDMPVKPDDRKVLYLALDRPRQIARALKRQFGEDDRKLLDDRLDIWPGPLPFDVAAEPNRLAELALERGAGTVFIDSIKDLAGNLGDPEAASAVNRALQFVTAAGVEPVGLHHQRKAQAGNVKPKRLDDVYGGMQLTAGAGSVLLLWGEPGDPLVELSTLKPAIGEIGPMVVSHDFTRGVTTIHEKVELLKLITDSPSGISAAEATISQYGSKFTAAERERVRRKLDRFVRDGNVERVEGTSPTDENRYQAKKGREAA